MTYMSDGKQHIGAGSEPNIISFALVEYASNGLARLCLGSPSPLGRKISLTTTQWTWAQAISRALWLAAMDHT